MDSETMHGKHEPEASRGRARFGTFVQEADDALVQSLGVALLLLTNLRLRLDDFPELENIVLDPLDVVGRRSGIAAGHLLGIGLELANILADDFRIDDVALRGDLGVRGGGEGH